MNDDTIAVLDAALNVIMRYGFKRTTMGDIAQAAGLSRQSLYARFANKHEVYAAGVILYGSRMIDALEKAWEKDTDITAAMDSIFEIAMVPTFQMLRQSPDSSDMIEAAESPEGRAAMAQVITDKRAALARLFEPYADALSQHGLTPDQLGEFVETNKGAFVESATDPTHLAMKFATLKASVIALTSAAPNKD